MPGGGPLQHIEYSSLNQYLILRNFPLLKSEGVVITECLPVISDFLIENCSGLNPIDLLRSILTVQASQTVHSLKRVRAVGFNETYDTDGSAVLDDLAKLADGSYVGLDSSGLAGSDPYPVLDGELTINTFCYEDSVLALRQIFTRLTINISGGFYIRFADPEVLRILLSNGMGDGTGFTKETAEKVTSIGTWFKGNTEITSFDEFEKFTGVTAFINYTTNSGNGAFTGATSLRSIKLPSSLIDLGKATFSGCTALESIGLEDDNNIEIIRGYVFNKCSSLNADLVFPKCAGSFMDMAFNGSGIKSISAPLVTSIGNRVTNNANGVFGLCKNLTRVYLPSVTSIGSYAFYGCTSLKEIVFGDLTKIDSAAFYNCTSLSFEELNFHNLETLGQNTFYGVKVKKMILGKEGGSLALSLGSGNTQNYGDKSVLESVEFKGVSELPKSSFENYSALTTFKVDDALTSLGESVFRNCTSLQGDLTFPNLISMGLSAFRETKIRSFIAPKLTSITSQSGYSPFHNCTSLIYVELISTTEIGSNGFYGCSALESIDLPSIVTLGEVAFRGCASLKHIRLGSNITSIGQYQFGDSTAAANKITEYIICEAITPPSLGTSAWYNTNNCPIYVPDASVTAYREASGWSAYADRIKPLSEYNVRILTYNEDGNGGYQLYQVANYDTAKNEYVMGIAVHGDNGDFVMHKNPISAPNIWIRTSNDKVNHLGYENTQMMLGAYPDDTNTYIHNKCHQTIFMDGSVGYLMSYGEGLDIWRKKDAIVNAMSKVGGSFTTGDYNWTSSWGHEGNQWMGVIVPWGETETSAAQSTVNSRSYKSNPITKFPEGIEW